MDHSRPTLVERLMHQRREHQHHERHHEGNELIAPRGALRENRGYLRSTCHHPNSCLRISKYPTAMNGTMNSNAQIVSWAKTPIGIFRSSVMNCSESKRVKLGIIEPRMPSSFHIPAR